MRGSHALLHWRRLNPTPDENGFSELKEALADREAECRTLRAALAAQPERPPRSNLRVGATKASKPVQSYVSCGVQTAELNRPAVRRRPRARPVRPSSAGAARDRGGIGFIGFCPEDVVDRFGREGSKTITLPPLPARVGSVPDFRLKGAQGASPDEEVEQDKADGRPDSSGPSPATATPGKDKHKPSESLQSLQTPALTEQERLHMADAVKAYQLFLLHDPRAKDLWPEQLTTLRQAPLPHSCQGDSSRWKSYQVEVREEIVDPHPVAIATPVESTEDVGLPGMVADEDDYRDPQSAPFRCICGFSAFSQMLYEDHECKFVMREAVRASVRASTTSRLKDVGLHHERVGMVSTKQGPQTVLVKTRDSGKVLFGPRPLEKERVLLHWVRTYNLCVFSPNA
eukprot:g31988.t1